MSLAGRAAGRLYPARRQANVPNPAMPASVPPSAFRPQISAPAATVGMSQHKAGIDPVVGWLVGSKGVSKGRDYRLH